MPSSAARNAQRAFAPQAAAGEAPICWRRARDTPAAARIRADEKWRKAPRNATVATPLVCAYAVSVRQQTYLPLLPPLPRLQPRKAANMRNGASRERLQRCSFTALFCYAARRYSGAAARLIVQTFQRYANENSLIIRPSIPSPMPCPSIAAPCARCMLMRHVLRFALRVRHAISWLIFAARPAPTPATRQRRRRAQRPRKIRHVFFFFFFACDGAAIFYYALPADVLAAAHPSA